MGIYTGQPEQPTWFVFRETDPGAPAMLELWADEMERRHISTPNRIASARDCAAAMRAKLPDPLNPPAQLTECCHGAITGEDRFCPRCGWEAHVIAPDPLNPPPIYSFTLDDGTVVHLPEPIIEETDRPPKE